MFQRFIRQSIRIVKTTNKPKFKWRPGVFATHLMFNIAMMALAAVVVIWLLLTWLDVWTDHGHYVEVPQVKGMTYAGAVGNLENNGFEAVLSDSIYDEKTRPGTVVEQNPKQGTKVKAGRTVYLTITAFSPKSVSLPSLTDVSLRQARSILEGLGFRNIYVEYVPSEFKDLVVSVRSDGRQLSAGARLPVTSSIILSAGEGVSDDTATSEEVDSLAL